jgi:YggT family protein
MDSSYKLTSPLLDRIRKFIPNLGSIDISPVVLILLLVFIRNILFEFFAPNIF